MVVDELLRLLRKTPGAAKTHLIQVRNGVMIHEAGVQDPTADVTVTMKRPVMLMTLYAGAPAAAMAASGGITVTGDITAYQAFAGMLEASTANFEVVTP